MRPSDIFTICHERYEECKRLTVKLGAINTAASAKQETRRAPQITKVMAFALDFELAGKRALCNKKRKNYQQYRMFNLYFCEGLRAGDVKRMLEISEDTFWSWSNSIKHAVGRELSIRGLFPPGRYFKQPAFVREGE